MRPQGSLLTDAEGRPKRTEYQKEAGASPAPAGLVDDPPQHLEKIWRTVDLIEDDKLLGMSFKKELRGLQLGKVLGRFQIEID